MHHHVAFIHCHACRYVYVRIHVNCMQQGRAGRSTNVCQHCVRPLLHCMLTHSSPGICTRCDLTNRFAVWFMTSTVSNPVTCYPCPSVICCLAEEACKHSTAERSRSSQQQHQAWIQASWFYHTSVNTLFQESTCDFPLSICCFTQTAEHRTAGS